MRRIPAIAAGLATVGVVVSAVWLQATRLDPDHHQRYVEALIRAEELDTRLDAELASARLGLVTHYDGLVAILDRVDANRAGLEHAPSWVTLEPELAAYDEAFRSKRELVERFKTQHAVLRNSVRLLPFLADRHPDPVAASTTVAAVLSASSDPTPTRWQRAADALALVEGTDLARHAGVVVERHPTVDTLVGQLMAVPVAERARDALAVYTRAHDAAVERQATRLLAFVISVALTVFFGCIAIILRLQRARDREADLARLRSRFVAMASHEFRTPLSVILSSTELLRRYGDRWDVDRAETHLSRVSVAVREMKDMLDRILVIGRNDATPLRHQPRPVVVSRILDAAVADVRAIAGDARALDVEDSSGDERIVLDERQMRHVLTNLLSNAVKYSPEDSIVRVSARREGDVLTLEVADEGIGIPRREQAQLFEAFHRCSNAVTFEGTGLGLAMVKAWVDAHRGTIEVDSDAGRGTRFTVRIPAEAA